jgi:hypothetical protein
MDAGAADGGAADGGLAVDAGVARDAGQPADAGVTPDAGQPADAGVMRDAGPGPIDGGVRFSVDVAPALQVCTGCHSDRATFAGVQPLVTPGDPATSILFLRITSQGRPMPPGAPLSMTNPQGTARIEAWIRAGARDD